MKILLPLIGLLASSIAGAGEVSGRIVVVGELAAPEPLPPGRDACCQAAAPVDQSVVVGEGGGLANVLVSVEPRRGETAPEADDKPSGEVVLTNRGCAFEPRVAIVRVGQKLVLANDDPTMHNVDVEFVKNRSVNLVVEPDGRRELPMTHAERRPVAARCNVHTFMRSWVVVRDDPYAALTDETGDFALPSLPTGDWRLRFWREGAPLAGLAVGVAMTDERGEVVVTVTDGPLELGELRVAAESFR